MAKYLLLGVFFLVPVLASAQPFPEDLLRQGIRITPDTTCRLHGSNRIETGRGAACLQCPPGEQKDPTHLLCAEGPFSGSSTPPTLSGTRVPPRKGEFQGQERLGGRELQNWEALEGTNLRKTPSATSEVIGSIRKGETFQVVGLSADGKWLEVETSDGATGYFWGSRAKRKP